MPRALAKDLIYTALRKQILSGELESDAQLREVELANQFSVSRTPVREALRQLESEQLIRVIPNVGAFVGSVSWQDAGEIFAIRKVLEAFAAQLASERFSPSDLATLEELLQDLRSAAERLDTTSYVAGDEAFHTLINERCGNRHLVDLIRSLNDRTKLVTLRRRAFQTSERLQASLAEHERIFAAIRARDAGAVSDHVWAHGQHFFEAVTVLNQSSNPLRRNGHGAHLEVF